MAYQKQFKEVYGNDYDGHWYPADGNREKVVIVLSGSDGGLEHASKHARFLADNNIPSFALALFKTKHTGKELNEVPVERVATLISWLQEKGYKKIGIDGTSKGTEYSLLAALQYPEISCVILKTPSYFYSEGLSNGQPTGECCWSKEGKSLPFTPYKERKINMLKLLWKAKEFNILEVNTGKKINPDSIIPIEKLQVPILMFSTKVDTIWPSYEACEYMIKRLEENNYAYPYKHIAFEHMSHMMLEYCGKEIKYFVKSEKEDPVACYRERDIMGEETVKWINDVWK